MNSLLCFGLLVVLAVASAVRAHDLPQVDFDWQTPSVLQQRSKTFESITDAVHEHRRRTSHMASLASNVSCVVCQDVGDYALKLLDNKTDAKTAAVLVEEYCKEKFANHSIDDAVCNLVPDAVMYAAELLRHRLHFNVPNIFCADLLHVCQQPCCLTEDTPEQVHLSFNTADDAVGISTTMRVAWATLKLLDLPNTGVHWREAWDSSAAWSSNVGTTETRDYHVGGWQGHLYSATMSKLKPNATYQYFVGDASSGRVSPVFNFTTLPLNAGTAARPLRVLGLADMGFGENGQPTIARMTEMVQSGEVDFIIHAGDVGYADGDQVYWDVFFREMQPIMSRVAYMVGPGNHECFFWNCSAYRHRFWMPAPSADGPSGALYYQIKAGPVSFYMLNTESAFDTPEVKDEQVGWLEERLAADVPAGRMAFVTHHRPLYCDAGNDDIMELNCADYALYLRAKLEPTYLKHNVSAVMCGHLHNYQRTLPIRKSHTAGRNYMNASAPMYLVNGGAGNREGNNHAGFSGKLSPWSAFNTVHRTFMMYYITADSAVVTLEAQTIRSLTNQVIDSFVIVKPRE